MPAIFSSDGRSFDFFKTEASVRIRRFRTDPDSQTRQRNCIFRRRIPVHFDSCRSSLKSHPKQAGVESHLERQDKTDQNSNCRADENRTVQQLLFI